MPTILERSEHEIGVPFAVCGFLEEGKTFPVCVNTSAQSISNDCGIGMFSFDPVTIAYGGVVILMAKPVAAPDALRGVRDVVKAIKEARPLPTSDSLEVLIQRAAASRGTPADIEAWAGKLARETGVLND